MFIFRNMIFCRAVSGFVTGYPCSVRGLGWTTCPLYRGVYVGKSVLNKLVCKFHKMETNVALPCEYILIAIIDIYCHWYIFIISAFKEFLYWLKYFVFAYPIDANFTFIWTKANYVNHFRMLTAHYQYLLNPTLVWYHLNFMYHQRNYL